MRTNFYKREISFCNSTSIFVKVHTLFCIHFLDFEADGTPLKYHVRSRIPWTWHVPTVRRSVDQKDRIWGGQRIRGLDGQMVKKSEGFLRFTNKSFVEDIVLEKD